MIDLPLPLWLLLLVVLVLIQVRDAARELTVSVYEVIGKSVHRYIEPVLRKKQMDEYEEAFRRTTAGIGKSIKQDKRGGVMEEEPKPIHTPCNAGGGDGDESPTTISSTSHRQGHLSSPSPRSSPPPR